MLEWWQALVLSVSSAAVGGFIAIAVAYAQHHWTTSTGREAEDREARRRVETEQREAIRQHRREQVRPILDFLGLAKRYAAREGVARLYNRLYEDEQFQLSMHVKRTQKEWEDYVRTEFLADDPELMEVARAFTVATASAASSEILDTIGEVWDVTRRDSSDEEDTAELRATIRTAEQFVERYLAEVEER